MIKVALSFGLTLMTATALAQPRPSTLNLSCSAARSLVAARGAVVLGTGPSTYDRFVRDWGFCDRFQTTEPALERTADSPQCFIGYRCKQEMKGDSSGGYQ